MKNTTKLKNILQLYTVSLDMDDEENFQLALSGKRDGDLQIFTDKSYTVVIAKAFAFMKKRLKNTENAFLRKKPL